MTRKILQVMAITFCLLITILNASEIKDAKSIEAGNLKSLDKAFVDFQKVNHADRLDLGLVIGKSVINNPKNFLKVLKKYRDKMVRLDELIANLGPNFPGKLEGQITEIEKRISSLKSVHDQDLQEVSSACVIELETRLKKLKAVM